MTPAPGAPLSAVGAACAAKRYDECEEKYSLALSTEFASSSIEVKYTKLLKLKRKKKKRRRRR